MWKLSVYTEEAYDMARRLAMEEGILVGQSAGAALCAALDLARRISEGVIVTILPDAGERYFSTRLWEG
jgi:cysteine synthase